MYYKGAHFFRILLIGVVLFLIAIFAAHSARADVPPEPDYEYMEETGFAYRSQYEVYGYSVYTMVTAEKGFGVTRAARAATPGGFAQAEKETPDIPKNAALLAFYHNDYPRDSGNSFELYNGKTCYISADGKPLGERKKPYYAIPEEYKDWVIAATEKDVVVYAKARNDSKKLGVIPAGGNVIYEPGKKYDKVLFGDQIAYVKTGALQPVNIEEMLKNWYMEDGTYIENGDWEYNGLYPGRVTGINTSPSYYPRDTTIKLEMDSSIPKIDRTLYEYTFPNKDNPMQAVYEVKQIGYFTLEYMSGDMSVAEPIEFSQKNDTLFYLNGQTLIVYSGKNKEVLLALKEAHGDPIYTLTPDSATRDDDLDLYKREDMDSAYLPWIPEDYRTGSIRIGADVNDTKGISFSVIMSYENLLAFYETTAESLDAKVTNFKKLDEIATEYKITLKDKSKLTVLIVHRRGYAYTIFIAFDAIKK